MAATDLHYLSLDEVARRLKARKLSSVEATQPPRISNRRNSTQRWAPARRLASSSSKGNQVRGARPR